LSQRYTRSEVERIVGLKARQLRYWERLRLVRPHARWRERFYSFGDLVALETIKRLTEKRIPARRLRRAVEVLERQLGGAPLPIEKLRVLSNGREIAVIPPGEHGPFEPLTGQLLLSFDTQPLARKVHKIISRTAEEWFEFALACDAEAEMRSEAVAAYRRVVELEPKWVEAQINLGVALYHLCQLEEARRAFRAALALDPVNGIAHFNLGCVLDELGDLDESIEHLRQAVKAMPAHADAHFNLALAYEKRGENQRARDHWSAYLRHEPRGPWSEHARSRLARAPSRKQSPAPIPFRKKG
jgi:tetratricopeptide (TPR) repeat protein